MRYVTVPPAIEIQGASVAFSDFIGDLLDRDERFTRTAAGIRKAVRIDQALRTSLPTLLVLEDSDYALLAAAVETPSAGYMTLSQTDSQGRIVRVFQIGRPLAAFIEAVLGAPDVPPPPPSAI